MADYAAWAARRLDAPLELLHVIDRSALKGSGEDHSGAIGFGAQEKLLDRLAAEDEMRARQGREQGRIFLNGLRERALAAGVAAVDMRQRYGALAETLVEQEENVRLVVIGRGGESSSQATSRVPGRNVERIVRALHKPILAAAGSFREPQRAVIAFDGGTVSRCCVELVAASPLFKGLPILLVTAGQAARSRAGEAEWARQTLAAEGFAVALAVIPGDVETAIVRAAEEQPVDLLVMGAYGHSHLRSLFFGSKTDDLLRVSSGATLLLRI